MNAKGTVKYSLVQMASGIMQRIVMRPWGMVDDV